MYVSSIAAATYSMPANKASKSEQLANCDKDIKTLKSFKDLLNKEVKTIQKSKMDHDFKQDALGELGIQKQLANNKIQQLTDERKSIAENRNKNDIESVTIAYGISYLA
jgi:hypothetical protein